VATGTFAPNTLQSTSKGLAFIAPDGLRIIDFNANVSDPVGNNGDGITVPFINALTPSRMAAGYNSGVYRVQVTNGQTGSTPQEWWYDFVRNLWSGPHTTGVSLYAPYKNTFVVTLAGALGSLWQSDPFQSLTSSFIENGNQLTFNYETPQLPDTDQMAENCVIESTLNTQLTIGNDITVNAIDENADILDTVYLLPSGTATLWGVFKWGGAVWGGTGQNPLVAQQLAWHQPLVFQRLTIQATGNSAYGTKLGRLHLRYQILGYLIERGYSYPTLFVLDQSQLGGHDVLG
jgi:hypothetical protein